MINENSCPIYSTVAPLRADLEPSQNSCPLFKFERITNERFDTHPIVTATGDNGVHEMNAYPPQIEDEEEIEPMRSDRRRYSTDDIEYLYHQWLGVYLPNKDKKPKCYTLKQLAFDCGMPLSSANYYVQKFELNPDWFMHYLIKNLE